MVSDTFISINLCNFFLGVGGFGRRASDGGAYLQTYCVEDGEQTVIHSSSNGHPVLVLQLFVILQSLPFHILLFTLNFYRTLIHPICRIIAAFP